MVAAFVLAIVSLVLYVGSAVAACAPSAITPAAATPVAALPVARTIGERSARHTDQSRLWGITLTYRRRVPARADYPPLGEPMMRPVDEVASVLAEPAIRAGPLLEQDHLSPRHALVDF